MRLTAFAEQKINTSIEQLLSRWMCTHQKVVLAFFSLYVNILASLITRKYTEKIDFPASVCLPLLS